MYVESNIFNQKRSYQISKRSTFRPNLDNTQKAMEQYLHEKGRVMDIWLQIRLFDMIHNLFYTNQTSECLYLRCLFCRH